MLRYASLTALVTLLLCSVLPAQQLEHMVPVGFNNPFLKSGQYITSLYFQNNSSEESRPESESGIERNAYSINMRSYLGLTDNITLSAALHFFPEQTISEGLYGTGGDATNSFYVQPEVVLSYRPTTAMEIFGSFNFSDYSRSYKASRGTTKRIIGIDENGEPIYGKEEFTIPPFPDSMQKSVSFNVGVTVSGQLW